jgi:hypothetical protein
MIMLAWGLPEMGDILRHSPVQARRCRLAGALLGALFQPLQQITPGALAPAYQVVERKGVAQRCRHEYGA